MLKKMVSILAGTVLTVTVSANVQASTITVQKGDTLWDLSQSNNTSVETIKELNKLTTDLIHPGDVLTLASQKQYTVELGDTLWDIARKHHVSVSQLKEWNQLSSDLIQPGLNLGIFEDVKTTTATKKLVQSVSIAQKESTSSLPSAEPQKEVNSAATKTQKETTTVAPTTTNSVDSQKVITMEATAYTATCEGCSGITSTGINLLENPDAKVISVDPSVIPLGSKVHVEGYGEAIAGDTGGAIKGKKIDVFIPNKQDAINFGRKDLKVTILD